MARSLGIPQFFSLFALVFFAPTVQLFAQISGSRVSDPAIEERVLGNVLDQSVGVGTLRDLALPENFLRRVVDRIICDSYQMHPIAGIPSRTAPDLQPLDLEFGEDARFRTGAFLFEAPVVRSETWSRLTPQRPANRAFRISGYAGEKVLFAPQSVESQTDEGRRVAELVRTQLARAGLRSVLVRSIQILDPYAMGRARDEEMARLEALGVPIDLLRYFDPHGNGQALIGEIAQKLLDGESVDEVTKDVESLPFRFRPSAPSFQIAPEDGSLAFRELRLQVTRGNYWGGRDDGGSLDIGRQLREQLPRVPLRVHLQSELAQAFLKTVEQWPESEAGRVRVLLEADKLSQWAQDNAKFGLAGDEPIYLAPRYASRQEDGSLFRPEETAALWTLARSGLRVVGSPLVFQGGDLLSARDPSTDSLTLFVGEAEIYRNTALGLTPEQVRDGFRIEFGADRLVVVPSISFHLDNDFFIRRVGDRQLAFVNDPGPAIRKIAEIGLERLIQAGLKLEIAQEARKHLENGELRTFVEIAGGYAFSRSQGNAFPYDLVEHFGATAEDPAAPINFLRFLAALDLLVEDQLTDDEIAGAGLPRAVFRSYRRLRSRRAELETLLQSQGCEVVRIPSYSVGRVSVCPINVLQDASRLLIPVVGSIYRSVDDAAISRYRAALGDEVRLIPILSSDSQSRLGGVHCTVSAMYEVDH